MRRRRAAACAGLLLAATHAYAHRLDEYLQATTLSIEKGRVQAQVRLAPGVAVFPTVLASIDTDADGIISEAEQRNYAEQVRRDLSLTVDGEYLPLRLISSTFDKINTLREGLGYIQLDFDADVPRRGLNRRLVFENHHQSLIAAYLVNGLVPRDPDIRLTAQDRNYDQSFYRLDYVDAGAHSSPLWSGWWSDPWAWLVTAALLLLSISLRWRRDRTALRRKRTAQ